MKYKMTYTFDIPNDIFETEYFCNCETKEDLKERLDQWDFENLGNHFNFKVKSELTSFKRK